VTRLSLSAELGIDGQDEVEESLEEKDISDSDCSSSVSAISSSRIVEGVARPSIGGVEA
jgi:hypothetical protein